MILKPLSKRRWFFYFCGMKLNDVILYACYLARKYSGKNVSHLFPRIHGNKLIIFDRINVEDSIVTIDFDSMWGLELCSYEGKICYWSNEFKWVPIYTDFEYEDIV